jgi:HEAT repeat protein
VREKAAFWLANNRGADGFEIVKSMVHSDKDEALRSKLVFDLTLVKGTSHQAAVDELIGLARNDASPKVRKDAQFWLAQQVAHSKSADPRIAETLRAATVSDPEASIRKSAVFALSRLPADQAATELIRVASTSNDPVVRHEAVFWLGQTKDARALDYLEKLAKQ